MDTPTTPEPTLENARKLLEAGRQALLVSLASANDQIRAFTSASDTLEQVGALDKLLQTLRAASAASFQSP